METAARAHLEAISNVVAGKTPPPIEDASQADWLAESWIRSVERYKLDPSKSSRRRVFTAAEIRESWDRAEIFRDVAKAHIDELFRQVSVANYCVLLTDASGLTVDFKATGEFEQTIKGSGLRLGTLWTEEEEGTCGVGTAIVNRRPTLVHKGEHFRVENIPMSCSAAPIFDADDELLAVLDASGLYSPYKRDSQALVFEMVIDKALTIENAYIARTLRHHWRLTLNPRPDCKTPHQDFLVAFNAAGEIVAANRPAREHLLSRFVDPRSLNIEDLLDLTADVLISGAYAAPGIALPMRITATGQLMFGTLRAPETQPQALRRTNASRPAVERASVDDPLTRLALSDATMLANADLARKVANRRLPLLLTGETGCGKEVFAKAVHDCSDRRDKPFVAMNCAAIPESLIESELFGYREGAFTGARSQGSRGKLQQSDGGTLFLDEIGDMPLTLQSRLLRVLAEGEVVPLGAEQPIKIALHVICATHRDLLGLVRQGLFREDLYYRLNGATIRLPALRDRGDVGALIKRIVREESEALGGDAFEIRLDTVERLKRYAWPGNIRQLRHAVRYACAVCDTTRLDLACFPVEIVEALSQPAPMATPTAAPMPSPVSRLPAPAMSFPPLPEALDRTGDQAVLDQMLSALEVTRWNVTAAAAHLNMPRSTFYRKMDHFGLTPPSRS